jgi:hypothetical protein
VDINPLHSEFHTTIAKSELSVALLGEDGVAAAAANCTPKQAQVRRKFKLVPRPSRIPLFLAFMNRSEYCSSMAVMVLKPLLQGQECAVE